MRVRQDAYFSLSSVDLSPEDITRAVGMEPDEVIVMASKRIEPPVPACHTWKVVATSRGPVDEMLAELVARIRPASSSIGDLVATGAASAVFQVVRSLDGASGEEEDLTIREIGDLRLEKLPGQHQLLGFHLDAQTLRFASDTGIEISFDEYG
jgi:hypothetical protein